MKRERRRESERAKRDRESARGWRFGVKVRGLVAEMRSRTSCGVSFCSGMPLYFFFFVVADDIHDVGFCMCVGRERDTCVGRERRVGEKEAGRERGG